MKKHQHPSNNAVLGAPRGVPIDVCEALPITRVQYADGSLACVSFWMPTPEELVRLNVGKAVAFVVTGTTHPPIYVGVDGGEDLPL